MKISAIKSLQGVYFDGVVDLIKPIKTKLYKDNMFYSFKLIFYFMFFQTEINKDYPSNESSVLFFSSDYIKNRRHAQEIKKNFMNCLNEKNIVDIKLIDILRLTSFFRKIPYFFIYYARLSSVNIKTIDRVIVSLGLSKTKVDLQYFREFFKCNNKNNLVVTFCDAIGAENLIAQIANDMNLKTITLQHGQYRVLTEKNISADVEAYENFVSNYMLCWGQATIDEFLKVGINISRMVSCGRLTDEIKINTKLTINHNVFGLALCGENQKEYNKALINFANEYSEFSGKGFIVRMHPSNDEEYYKNMLNDNCLNIKEYNNSEYFSLCDFTILGMTGVFVDCMEVSHKFLFYDNGYLADIFLNSGCVVVNVKDVHVMLNIQNANFIKNLEIKYNDRVNQNEIINNLIDGLIN